MNWRKVVKGALVVAAVVAAIALGVRYWKSGDVTSESDSTEVKTAKATRGPLRQTVDCTGSVVSNLDVEIKCRASGEVIKLPFDVSDPVKKGDLLLELDPVDQERLVQQSEASLSASKARLAQAEAALAVATKSLEADRQKAAAAVQSAQARSSDAGAKANREQQLLDKKYSSPEGVETARTTAVQAEQDLKTAQAQIESLKAQELDLETKRQQINLNKAQIESDTISLSLAQRQLKYTSVTSPIDGVVSERKVQIGQIISSGISNIGGGTAVMMISDVSRIFILAAVDESNIGFVSLGQSADITADSYPSKRFTGTVNRIAAKGANLQNVVTFEVRIEVLSEDKILLKPVMTTNVRIVVADKSDVLKVPYTALVRDKGETFVTPMNADGTPGEKRRVEVGVTDGSETEIASGLEEGEEVLVQDAEAESRWRAGDPNQAARQRMMMMRTIGGGGPPGGGRPR